MTIDLPVSSSENTHENNQAYNRFGKMLLALFVSFYLYRSTDVKQR